MSEQRLKCRYASIGKEPQVMKVTFKSTGDSDIVEMAHIKDTAQNSDKAICTRSTGLCLGGKQLSRMPHHPQAVEVVRIKTREAQDTSPPRMLWIGQRIY